uniref:Uncharacterized protein n=1 Tax=Arundo donax TaxID=35708 RepID=A0A0A9CPD4_ARUDO
MPSLASVFFQFIHSFGYPNSISSPSNPLPSMVCCAFCWLLFGPNPLLF